MRRSAGGDGSLHVTFTLEDVSWEKWSCVMGRTPETWRGEMQPQLSGDPSLHIVPSTCTGNTQERWQTWSSGLSIDLKLCWDQEAEAGREKRCFSQVCLQTLSISDPYGEWWDCPTADDMCCLGFLTAGFSSRGPCEVPQGFISPSYGHTGHPDHRGQHELSVSPTLPCPYGTLQPSKCAQCCW